VEERVKAIRERKEKEALSERSSIMGGKE